MSRSPPLHPSAGQVVALEASEFLAALVNARRFAGLSQLDVARAMGTTQSAVSEWETGVVSPRLSRLLRYAAVIGVELRVSPPKPSPLVGTRLSMRMSAVSAAEPEERD